MKNQLSETPRTAEISKAVQNQNWGFRDMQILAGQLERELNQCVTALKAVANRKTIGDEFDAASAAGLRAAHGSALPARVMQTKFRSDGDCFNACLASLLGVPLESVGYFRDEKTWYADLQAWLKPRGLAYVEIMVQPWNFYRFPLPVLAIAGGPSPRGEGGHAVIVELHRYDRKLVHDPHPSGAGVLKIETIGLLTWQPSAPNDELCGSQ